MIFERSLRLSGSAKIYVQPGKETSLYNSII